MKTSFSTALTTLIAAFVMTAQAAPAASKLQARSSMSGDATYYSVGMGSCGKTNSDGEMVAALSEKLMGTGADGSYCGKSITLTSKGGKSVTVKVVDSCPGCGEGDVDLSPSAFKKLGSLDQGVIPITWSL
ncbi:riboflavin-aldehyde forming enzyme [Mucor ambiguus]|uniref:Riboflavin-aldehyde forming enzyme n=1 Tax=Mucor ambiguus TaxID=91626 RepID=A0A0C9N4C7_9FUNG|nr:riboflavin-aldehyde forming enzyme [Mucor ambiguus]